LLSEVAQVARAGIGRISVVVSQVPHRHDTERAHRREGARLRASERVDPLPCVINNLPLGAAWQVDAAHEGISRIEAAPSLFPLRPAAVFVVTSAVAGIIIPVVGARATSETAGVIIRLARVCLGLPPVVIVIRDVVDIATASAATSFEPVVRSRIVIARIKVHKRLPQATLSWRNRRRLGTRPRAC
jgi:hypothetical protein